VELKPHNTTKNATAQTSLISLRSIRDPRRWPAHIPQHRIALSRNENTPRLGFEPREACANTLTQETIPCPYQIRGLDRGRSRGKPPNPKTVSWAQEMLGISLCFDATPKDFRPGPKRCFASLWVSRCGKGASRRAQYQIVPPRQQCWKEMHVL
jgi:hypothetical protein